MHPDDHEPFMQTAYALIVAMSAGTPLCLQGVRLHSVRALHRVSYHRDGKTFEVMVDSLITATRPDRRASPRPSCRAQDPGRPAPWRHGFGHPARPPSRPSESVLPHAAARLRAAGWAQGPA